MIWKEVVTLWGCNLFLLLIYLLFEFLQFVHPVTIFGRRKEIESFG